MRDLLRQLRGLHSLGHDRQLRVEQAGHVIRCHRGRVWVEPRGERIVACPSGNFRE
jgi:tRNA(Ile)-lysidine synthase